MNKVDIALIAAATVQRINMTVMMPLVAALEEDGCSEEIQTQVIREVKRQSHLLFEFLDTDMTQQELIDQLGSGL